jgi:hypothetical protein
MTSASCLKSASVLRGFLHQTYQACQRIFQGRLDDEESRQAALGPRHCCYIRFRELPPIPFRTFSSEARPSTRWHSPSKARTRSFSLCFATCTFLYPCVRALVRPSVRCTAEPESMQWNVAMEPAVHPIPGRHHLRVLTPPVRLNQS